MNYTKRMNKIKEEISLDNLDKALNDLGIDNLNDDYKIERGNKKQWKQ